MTSQQGEEEEGRGELFLFKQRTTEDRPGIDKLQPQVHLECVFLFSLLNLKKLY